MSGFTLFCTAIVTPVDLKDLGVKPLPPKPAKLMVFVKMLDNEDDDNAAYG